MMNQYPRYPNAPPRSLVRMPSQSDYPVSNRMKTLRCMFLPRFF